jgi:hypothetical protein
MRAWVVAATVLILTVAATAPATARPCRNEARVVGACFAVHGRLHYFNGNPSLRMWRVGTTRYLGIHDDEEPLVPSNLAACLRGFERTVYGDFVFCPFTRARPGWMQMGCIESARNLIVEDEGGTARRCDAAR